MKELMIFEGQEVEVFEFDGIVLFNPYHIGKCLQIGENGVKSAVSKMNTKQVVKLTNSEVAKYNFRKLNNAGENFLTESGVYKLVFKSHKPDAEKFTDWITDEVLPSIRKTGTYTINPNPLNPVIAEGVANLARVTERIMKAQGSYPYKIAEVFKVECEQFGIHLPDDFVKMPEVQQLTLFN